MSITAALGAFGIVKKLLGLTQKDGTPSEEPGRNMMRLIMVLLAVIPLVGALSYCSGKKQANKVIDGYVSDLAKSRVEKQKVQTVIQTQIVTEFKDRVAYIESVKFLNRDVVRLVPQLAVDTNNVPYIPMGVINVINAASEGREATTDEAADVRNSQVTLDVLGEVVSSNLAETFKAQSAVRAWEGWYDDTSVNWNSKNGKLPKESIAELPIATPTKIEIENPEQGE